MTSNEVAQKLGPASKMGRRISGIPGPITCAGLKNRQRSAPSLPDRLAPQWVDATVNSPTADSTGKSRKSYEKFHVKHIDVTARNHGELTKYGGNPVRVGNDRHRAEILRARVIRATTEYRPKIAPI